MRRVAQIMGMPISVDIPDCDKEQLFEDVFGLFREIDQKFSPYKENSELTRYNGEELSKKELSNEMKTVIKACMDWQKKTNGYFDAWYGEKFDPSGYVKGWAIKRAGDLIKEQGYKTFCISAGGDIMASSAGAKKWNIGIQDPTDKSKILNQLSISNGAIATSGTYERGGHIINSKTGKPAKEFLSLTVIGPDIITADVLATAAFAMGKRGIDLVNKFGYKSLAVYKM